MQPDDVPPSTSLPVASHSGGEFTTTSDKVVGLHSNTSNLWIPSHSSSFHTAAISANLMGMFYHPLIFQTFHTVHVPFTAGVPLHSFSTLRRLCTSVPIHARKYERSGMYLRRGTPARMLDTMHHQIRLVMCRMARRTSAPVYVRCGVVSE
jgi:hypothetical protein